MISAVPARPESRATSDEWFTLSKLLLLVAAFVVIAFPSVVTGASSLFYRDMGQFGYPLAQFHREAFWRGEIPLWNPLNNCGLPFLAQWNTLVLYPGSLIYLLLPLPWSMSSGERAISSGRFAGLRVVVASLRERAARASLESQPRFSGVDRSRRTTSRGVALLRSDVSLRCCRILAEYIDVPRVTFPASDVRSSPGELSGIFPCANSRFVPNTNRTTRRYNRRMTILQSRLSGLFFKDFGLWVAHAAEAVHFESHERAWHFIHEERVTDVAVRELPGDVVSTLRDVSE